jgi:hypothetical protein
MSPIGAWMSYRIQLVALEQVTKRSRIVGCGYSAGRVEPARALAIARRCNGQSLPMKVRPNVGASLAAGLAYEPRLEIEKPDVIGPLVRADRDRMAAMIVRAIDQHAAHAG